MNSELKYEYTELNRIYERLEHVEDEKLLEVLCEELAIQKRKISLLLKVEKILQEQARVERVKALISKNKNIQG
jgi:hypothetical protein